MMFCIYGKSRVLAKNTIDKQILKKSTAVNKEILELGEDCTQDEKQQIVNKHIQIEFEQMKPKRCTHEFSTPFIAREALEIMLNDTDNFSDLVLMKKAYKLNAEGKKLATPSGKPKMEWVSIHEESKEVLAA